MKLILGSSSKYRKAVLAEKGFDFATMSPDIDERAINSDNYYELPLLLARAKAEALLHNISEPVIIVTADQITICNGNLHHKPSSKEEAKLYLKRYSDGYPAETVSALVVVNTQTGERAEGVDIAKTYFKEMPDHIIEELIEKGDLYSKGGGFSIQSPISEPYLSKIEGTIESIMGMPVSLLEKLIKQVS